MTSAGPLLGEPHLVDDVGPASGGRSPGASLRVAVLLTPLLTASALVIVPVVGYPLRTVLDGSAGRASLVFADPDVWRATLRTLVWAVVAPLAVVSLAYPVAVGLGRGRLARSVGVLLLVPVALPLSVVGVGFRLLLDQTPYPGNLLWVLRGLGVDPTTVTAPLGPDLAMESLIAAFTWCWLGLAVLVIRRALDRVPAGIEDAVRAEGGRFLDVVRHVHLPHLRGVLTVLVALLSVVSGRSFDLILLTTTGLSRNEVETLAVYLWLRVGQQDDPAVVSVLGVVWLFVVLVGVGTTVGAVRLLVRRLAMPGERPNGRPRRRRTGRVPAPPGRVRIAVVTGLLPLWLVPLLLVVGTSVHRRDDAAFHRWWSPLSADSYTALLTGSELGRALLLTTPLVAGAATLVAVAVGLTGGYALAWYQPPGSMLITTMLFGAAVTPVQVLVPLLRAPLARVYPTGAFVLPVIVHIGLCVPVATLVLRQAFAAVPRQLVYLDRLRTTGELAALARTAWRRIRASIVAVAVLLFVLVWSDLVVGLSVAGSGSAGVVLSGQARDFDSNVGMVTAGAVAFAAVPVCLVLLLRRWLVEGLAWGVVDR